MQALAQSSSLSVNARCAVYRTFADCASFAKPWDEAVESLGGSVYMTFDWCKTWWDFYGAEKELRVLICSEDEKIVGILPLYIEDIKFGPFKFRVARLVGSNIPPKAFKPAIADCCAEKLFGEMLRQILENDRCDLISLGPISTTQNSPALLEQTCTTHKNIVGSFEAVDGVHSVFHLPGDMEQFYAGLSKSERKNRKYEARVMERSRVIKHDILSDPALVVEDFNRFADQHATQWQAERRPGHFGSWPRALEYNRVLVQRQAQQGRVRFVRILADEKVIANQFCFSFGDTYYWELPSRDIAPEWERISLGSAGALAMVSAAIGEGKKLAEAGLASYEYKKRLGAIEYPTKTLRIVSRRGASLRRYRTFLLVRGMFEVLYHKVWYRRIAPKLTPKFCGPQNMLWLRFDF